LDKIFPNNKLLVFLFHKNLPFFSQKVPSNYENEFFSFFLPL